MSELSDMLRKTVACTRCGEEKATLPWNAVAAIATATCLDCARTIEAEAITEARNLYEREGQQKAARAGRMAIFALAGDGPTKPTSHDEALAGLIGAGGGFILAPGSPEASNAAWRACWLAADTQPGAIRRIGGGPESLTLAAHNKASFNDAAEIKKRYISPLYTTVVVTGVGTGGFINAKRRHEEWSALVDAVVTNRQRVVLSATSTRVISSDEAWDRAAGWMGEDAARRLQSLIGQATLLG